MSEEEKDFKELCQTLRSAKVDKKNAVKVEKKAKESMTNYLNKHEVEKGDHYGIKIMHRYKFLSTNIKVAKKHKVEVPTDKVISLKLSPDRVRSLIKDGILKEDEVDIKEIVDMKALEKNMEKAGLEEEMEYSLSYSYGFGK